MEAKRSKYEYDRDYYERKNGYYTNGSNAYRLRPLEDPWEEELRAAAPARREVPERRDVPKKRPVRTAAPRRKHEPVKRPVKAAEPKVKVKVVSGIDFLTVSVIVLAMAATLFVCIEFLMLKSDMVQIDKDIAAANVELNTAMDRNKAVQEELDAALDLEYIYAVAVGKLGMVYPSSDQIVSYDAAASGYVRQYEEIPDTAEKIPDISGLQP